MKDSCKGKAFISACGWLGGVITKQLAEIRKCADCSVVQRRQCLTRCSRAPRWLAFCGFEQFVSISRSPRTHAIRFFSVFWTIRSWFHFAAYARNVFSQPFDNKATNVKPKKPRCTCSMLLLELPYASVRPSVHPSLSSDSSAALQTVIHAVFTGVAALSISFISLVPCGVSLFVSRRLPDCHHCCSPSPGPRL